MLGDAPLTRRAGDGAHRLGQRRRQPDRDAARQAARRPARPDRRGHDARERLPAGRHAARRPGAGIVGSTIQFHGTADRYTLNGATAVATLYSNATTATANPAVTLRSVGTSGGQAAAFTYDLARSVVYTRQGNPALGRPGARRRRWRSGPTTSSSAPSAGDVQPDWLDTNKIAIPQADEQQRLLANLITLMERDQHAAAALLVPAARREGRVVMTGDDHCRPGARRHARPLRPLQGAQPARLLGRELGVRARDVLRLPEQRRSRTRRRLVRRRGLRGRAAPRTSAGCPTRADWTPTTLASRYDTQLQRSRAKYTSVPAPVIEPHPLRRVARLGDAAEGRAGARHPAGHELLPLPRQLDRREARLHDRRRLPDALRRHSTGRSIDVYQANTHMTDESRPGLPGHGQRAARQRARPEGVLRRVRHEHAHRQRGAACRLRGDRRLGAGARRARDLGQAAARPGSDGRNSSTFRGLSWNAGTLTFTTTVGAGANGLQTMLPTQGPTGTLSALTCAGTPRAYTVQTIKGIQYAHVRHDHRHLSGDVLVTVEPRTRTR